MSNRSSSYRFTVQMQNGKPVSQHAHLVEALRKTISVEDSWNGTQRYVKLQGRGPRLGNRSYSKSLPLTLSVYADVYVYNQ